MTHAQSSYYSHVKGCEECSLNMEQKRVSLLCRQGFHLYRCAIDLMEPGKAQAWTDRIQEEYNFWLMQADYEAGEAVQDLEAKVFDIRTDAMNLALHLEAVNAPEWQGVLGLADALQKQLKAIGEKFPKAVSL